MSWLSSVRSWLTRASAAVLVGLLALTILSAGATNYQINQRSEARQRYEAERTVELIDREIQIYTEVLYGNRALFSGEQEVTREEFDSHMTNTAIRARFPGVQGVFYANHVTHENRDELVAEVNAEIAGSATPYGRFIVTPPGDRATYTVVSYAYPHEPNARAFGFDLASEERRAEAINRARDTGLPAATRPITLVQETGDQQAFLIMLPEYIQDLPTDTVEQRRAAFRGVHTMGFRVGDLLNSLLDGALLQGSSVQVAAGVPPGYPAGEFPEDLQVFTNAEGLVESDTDAPVVPLKVAGQQWLIKYNGTNEALSPAQRLQPAMIAVVGAFLSLVVAILLGLAQKARRRALRNAARAQQLHRVTARFAESLTAEEVGAAVIDDLDDIFSTDGGGVALITNDGKAFKWLAIQGVSAETVAMAEPVPCAQDSKSESALIDAINSRVLVDRTDVEEPLAVQALLPEGVDRDVHSSVLALPLIASGEVVGGWVMSWRGNRTLTSTERELLETMSTQCAQALERALLFKREQERAEAEHNIALSLQRSLLPHDLPELADADVAVRYLPAGAGQEVGGDWYDVSVTPQNRIAVALGDVAGHGIEAATVMGQVRNMMRAYAFEGHSPGLVLERVNRLLVANAAPFSTCSYCEIDPVSGHVNMVRAGHMPCIIKHADSTAELVNDEANLPLAIDANMTFVETSFFLAPGETLVLFSDGLVERGGLNIADRLEMLRETVESLSDHRPDAMLETIVDTMLADVGRRDDVAVLALRFDPVNARTTEAGAEVRRVFPSEPTSARAARNFLRDVITEWEITEVLDDAVLCASELFTNSLIHSTGEIELRLAVDNGALRVALLDSSERQPMVKSVDDTATTGRGLMIVETVATGWGTEQLATGKSVWFEINLP